MNEKKCERCQNEISACVCAKYLNEFTKTETNSGEIEPDFYFDDDGLMVFTKAYHLKRGTCCENKCRHCPY